jgi:hypothetical protein
MKTKICSECKKRKPISQFYAGNDKFGYDYRCKKCHKLYAEINRNKIIVYKKQYAKINKLKIALHDKFYQLTPEGIYAHIKAGAKITKIYFEINKKDFTEWYNNQEKRCVYCERTLDETQKDGNGHYSRLSIDRKDNNKGYEIDNIVLACNRCNIIKSNAFSYKQMLKVGKILQETLKES